jgi:hypothetical protein
MLLSTFDPLVQYPIRMLTQVHLEVTCGPEGDRGAARESADKALRRTSTRRASWPLKGYHILFRAMPRIPLLGLGRDPFLRILSVQAEAWVDLQWGVPAFV